MEAVTIASQFSPATGVRLSSPASCRSSAPKRTLSFSPSPKSSLSTSFISPFVGGSVLADFSGHRIRPDSLRPSSSSSRPKRGVVTMVIPFSRGSAWEQPPPDLASYLYKNRIVYLGMSLVPSVTELILAEFLYLQYEDEEKPIYLYVNSTGTTKGGEKLGYETEAFAIYDVMRYVKPPIFTLCVGNAWGEAALLLAAGAKGNRAALPSSTIMIKQPIARFQGQATDVELMRKEVKNVKAELVIFKISVKLMLAYCDKSSRDNFALFKDFCFLFCDILCCYCYTVSFSSYCAEGLSETVSLLLRSRGKVCVHTTLPRPHL